MSMQTMQSVLCRGAVDGGFLSTLLAAPYEALAQYDLSADERAVMAETPARSLTDLAVAVEAWRRGDAIGVGVRELALVG